MDKRKAELTCERLLSENKKLRLVAYISYPGAEYVAQVSRRPLGPQPKIQKELRAVLSRAMEIEYEKVWGKLDYILRSFASLRTIEIPIDHGIVVASTDPIEDVATLIGLAKKARKVFTESQ